MQKHLGFCIIAYARLVQRLHLPTQPAEDDFARPFSSNVSAHGCQSIECYEPGNITRAHR
jgi:hypothetical protein